jgi:lipopolysaccharide biosynthesis regulator YciM
MSITKIYFDLSLMSEFGVAICQTPLIVLRHKINERKEIKMISKCTTCGYTAEPQDIWCRVCSDLKATPKVWVRMQHVMDITQ